METHDTCRNDLNVVGHLDINELMRDLDRFCRSCYNLSFPFTRNQLLRRNIKIKNSLKLVFTYSLKKVYVKDVDNSIISQVKGKQIMTLHNVLS